MITLQGKYCKDCIIFTDDIEEEALKTIRQILDCKAFENAKIRIMPDVHQGKGIVIGFTSPIGNYICPSHVGVDIGCMIDTYITDTDVNEAEFALIEHRIRKEIPFGFEIYNQTQIDYKHFYKFMNNGLNRMRSLWPEMIDSCAYCGEEGVSDLCHRIGMDEGKFYKSLGTIGGGNHFVEIGKTPEGKYAFTIHCGSRNLGTKVCQYWEKMAMKGLSKKEIKDITAEFKEVWQLKNKPMKGFKDALNAHLEEQKSKRINGFLEGENMVGYLTDMAIAQLYSEYNHYVISQKIEKILNNINGAKVVSKIVSVHNYVDFRDHIIRKGAIRSYEGESMVIPFNMRDGIAICVGKSNENTNCSAPHGSGRKKSRTEAKKTLSLETFRTQMQNVYSTSVCKATLDEAPDAYKPTDEILGLIKETCDVLYLIPPVINLKATDEGD